MSNLQTKNIQLLQAFSKQKQMKHVLDILSEWLVQRHLTTVPRLIVKRGEHKTHSNSTKNRTHTTALTYYCVNKILAPTHTKVKVCAHVVVGRC